MATALGSLPSASSSATTAPSIPANATLGRHLARRLAEVGARDVFTVPGDFNLTLLDELEAEQPSGGGMRLVGCCNELNAAYAADGYARAGRGVGASNTSTVGESVVLPSLSMEEVLVNGDPLGARHQQHAARQRYGAEIPALR
ncbi:hypothetical protein QYE76_050077 [Lolium multiflorum]|uniref:pyruvate decarboxylase n=1 Tax=Lolium multiflorum TaxID=4521 RepID=A0AAD8SP76_LOLMU|nr:hypothetical protein QYE76_050077 [Lolium multiflorum]